MPSSTVIVVAEDLARAEKARRCLEEGSRPDFRVDCHRGLDQAIENLRRRPYDLLLIDLALPRQAGLDTLLRARMLAHRIPIVLMTDHRDEELAVQAIEAGVQEYLILDDGLPADLGRRLRQAMVRHRLAAKLRRGQQGAGTGTFFDPVTGLVAEEVFLRRCEETLALAARFGERPALILLEVDGYQEIESRTGRLRAVRMVQELSRRLTWCVRRADLLGALGEGRFGVLLANVTGPPGIRLVAERLRLAAASPFDGRGSGLSASIGASWFPIDGLTTDQLLRHAGAALLEARSQGGNRWRQSGTLVLPAWPEAALADLPEPAALFDWNELRLD